MSEEQNYDNYQEAKGKVLLGIENMVKYGNLLGFDLLAIADDIREKITEANEELYDEI